MERWGHILVVDGNPYVRELVGVMLETPTCHVTGLADEQALREFLSADDSVDLVILDCWMPSERNAALALKLKAMGMPLVLISGNPDVVRFAVEHGLCLVRKPFRTTDLRSVLDDAIVPRRGRADRRSARRR